MLYRREHWKADGRRLWLYSDAPIPEVDPLLIPVPDRRTVEVSSQMRWHPIAGEWVLYSAHRQDRTFMPGSGEDPLARTSDPASPTELPPGDYKVAVFENRFPSLSMAADSAPAASGVVAAPALGRAEVVVFSADANAALGSLPVEEVALILEVWRDRTEAMASTGARSVLVFENRGVEMGMTLPHPHAQIYGYNFLPAKAEGEWRRLSAYRAMTGQDFLVETVAREVALELRTVVVRERSVAFTPAFGRFPYETWVTPRQPVPDLSHLSDEERHDLAASLKEALQRLDGLWQSPVPYLLTVNQLPIGLAPDGWTLRIEICPVRRSREKVKFLAGTELGAGVFANDVLPERAAQALRAVVL